MSLSLFWKASLSASAQIVGSAISVELNTLVPGMVHPFGNNITVVSESIASTSFADLIIGGISAQVGGLQGLSLATPAAGQAVSSDHLWSSLLSNVTQITGTTPTGASFSYLLINRAIDFPTAHVPLVATLPLMLIGGIGLIRRRRMTRG